MRRSLIIGGTKGLGRALAIESFTRGIPPVVVGRSVRLARNDPELEGADFCEADLTDPDSFRNVVLHFRSGISHLFWVAGIFLRKPLTECTQEEIVRMTQVHFLGPVQVLSAFHRMQKLQRQLADDPGLPYHLVTIASTSSWKMRDDETVYCALKAAKAHFTRNFARELLRDLPMSKVTLVNPGGIKTPEFWAGTGQDMSSYMEPKALARVIWDEVLLQAEPFREVNIPRDAEGNPVVESGSRAPESPS
jgi:NAD(P)-dependent dehydrogenase (short-subunit alcohol dehydrogenase family)